MYSSMSTFEFFVCRAAMGSDSERSLGAAPRSAASKMKLRRNQGRRLRSVCFLTASFPISYPHQVLAALTPSSDQHHASPVSSAAQHQRKSTAAQSALLLRRHNYYQYRAKDGKNNRHDPQQEQEDPHRTKNTKFVESGASETASLQHSKQAAAGQLRDNTKPIAIGKMKEKQGGSDTSSSTSSTTKLSGNPSAADVVLAKLRREKPYLVFDDREHKLPSPFASWSVFQQISAAVGSDFLHGVQLLIGGPQRTSTKLSGEQRTESAHDDAPTASNRPPVADDTTHARTASTSSLQSAATPEVSFLKITDSICLSRTAFVQMVHASFLKITDSICLSRTALVQMVGGLCSLLILGLAWHFFGSGAEKAGASAATSRRHRHHPVGSLTARAEGEQTAPLLGPQVVVEEEPTLEEKITKSEIAKIYRNSPPRSFSSSPLSQLRADAAEQAKTVLFQLDDEEDAITRSLNAGRASDQMLKNANSQGGIISTTAAAGAAKYFDMTRDDSNSPAGTEDRDQNISPATMMSSLRQELDDTVSPTSPSGRTAGATAAAAAGAAAGASSSSTAVANTTSSSPTTGVVDRTKELFSLFNAKLAARNLSVKVEERKKSRLDGGTNKNMSSGDINYTVPRDLIEHTQTEDYEQEVMKQDHALVQVVRAHSLKSTSTYAVIKLGDASRQSQVVSGTTKPYFRYTTRIPYDGKSLEAVFQVYDTGRTTNDDENDLDFTAELTQKQPVLLGECRLKVRKHAKGGCLLQKQDELPLYLPSDVEKVENSENTTSGSFAEKMKDMPVQGKLAFKWQLFRERKKKRKGGAGENEDIEGEGTMTRGENSRTNGRVDEDEDQGLAGG
ncbi:unnamed protein product [Amoebophrya sp. A120]|nr:unnamed protein product [Amoebophrya sp. A120]|eukprot:GSA120T00004058001.1